MPPVFLPHCNLPVIQRISGHLLDDSRIPTPPKDIPDCANERMRRLPPDNACALITATGIAEFHPGPLSLDFKAEPSGEGPCAWDLIAHLKIPDFCPDVSTLSEVKSVPPDQPPRVEFYLGEPGADSLSESTSAELFGCDLDFILKMDFPVGAGIYTGEATATINPALTKPKVDLTVTEVTRAIEPLTGPTTYHFSFVFEYPTTPPPVAFMCIRDFNCALDGTPSIHWQEVHLPPNAVVVDLGWFDYPCCGGTGTTTSTTTTSTSTTTTTGTFTTTSGTGPICTICNVPNVVLVNVTGFPAGSPYNGTFTLPSAFNFNLNEPCYWRPANAGGGVAYWELYKFHLTSTTFDWELSAVFPATTLAYNANSPTLNCPGDTTFTMNYVDPSFSSYPIHIQVHIP